MKRRVITVFLGIFLVLVCGSLGGERPAFAQTERIPAAKRKELERKAQIDFVAGRYQPAIDLLAQLYADFKEPAYLRNIGRCYQRLREPDRAIASFDEYLQKGRDISPTEREEINGFIREMQELKKTREATAAPVPVPPPAPVSTPAPEPTPPSAALPPAAIVAAPPPAAPLGSNPTVVATTVLPAPPSKMGTGRVAGLVMVAAGAVIAGAGGLTASSAWSRFDDAKKKDGCPAASDVCNKAATDVKSKNTLAKILFAAGAVVGVTGAVVFFVSPTASPDSPSATAAHDGFVLGAQGRF